MSEAEFVQSNSYRRADYHRLDAYEDFIVNQLKDTCRSRYSQETGKLIADHELNAGKGKLVKNSSHKRDRDSSLEELKEKVKAYIGSSECVTAYLSETRIRKIRY